MQRWMMVLMVLILSLAVAVGACAAPAPAPAPTPKPAPAPKPAPKPVSAADFYRDNTVTILVNSKPGGGTDYGARLMSAYWNELAGGNMIVKNEPGGGGMVAVNQIWKAEPDGLTIGTAVFASHVIGYPLFKKSGAEYAPQKFTYMGHFGKDAYSLTVGIDSPYESIEDLQKAKGLIFGAPEAVGTITMGTALAIEFFGLDGKIVAGFRGGELGLAAAKGEIVGYTIHGGGLITDLGKNFIKQPFVTMAFERSEYFPDVPALPELVTLTPEQKTLLTIFITMTSGKVFYAPPGVPEDRVEFLRGAFEKLMENTGFLRQAKLRWAVWSEPMTGEEAAKFVDEVFSIPEADIFKYSSLSDKYLK